MAIDTTVTFDGQTEGAAVTLPAGWATQSTGPLAAAAAAAHGDRGAQFSSATSGRIHYDYGSNQSARAIVPTFYFNMSAVPTGNLHIAAIYSATSAGTIQGDLRIISGGAAQIRNGSTAVANSGATTLAANTWYRVEWRTKAGTSSGQELRVYLGEAASPLITLTGAWSAAAARAVYVGPYVALAGGPTVRYDTIRLADDFVGAFAPPAVTRRWHRKTSGGLVEMTPRRITA